LLHDFSTWNNWKFNAKASKKAKVKFCHTLFWTEGKNVKIFYERKFSIYIKISKPAAVMRAWKVVWDWCLCERLEWLFYRHGYPQLHDNGHGKYRGAWGYLHILSWYHLCERESDRPQRPIRKSKYPTVKQISNPWWKCNFHGSSLTQIYDEGILQCSLRNMLHVLNENWKVYFSPPWLQFQPK